LVLPSLALFVEQRLPHFMQSNSTFVVSDLAMIGLEHSKEQAF
jgi:hypothetical protein